MDAIRQIQDADVISCGFYFSSPAAAEIPAAVTDLAAHSPAITAAYWLSCFCSAAVEAMALAVTDLSLIHIYSSYDKSRLPALQIH